MIHFTKGIVLHRFKYSDSKYITKIYTEKFGLQSYMLYGASPKKLRSTLLQPLYLLDMQVYRKNTEDLQKIKQIGIDFPLTGMSGNFKKQTISIFLSEFILSCLRKNDPDPALFSFIRQSVLQLNSPEENMDFHLLFMLRLTEYLGIMPQNNYSESRKIFDLRAARFIVGHPTHPAYMNERESSLFAQLFQTDRTCSFSNNERSMLLEKLLEFYKIHLGVTQKMQTLSVMREIFREEKTL